MRIHFLHTPMINADLPGREKFWFGFEANYKLFHPRLIPMRYPRWEIPHWIPWLAGCLRKRGFDDLAVTWWSNEKLYDMDSVQQELFRIADNSDIVLQSPMVPNLKVCKILFEIIKTRNPRVYTILGGVTAIPLLEHLRQWSCLDVIVSGRAERSLPEIVERLSRLKEILNIPNVSARGKNGRWNSSEPRAEWIEPHDIPWPAIDLISSEFGQDIKYLRIVHGIGCPYTCAFCTIPTIGRKQSFFSVDRTMQEIKAYRQRFGEHHGIYFGDETFLLDRAKYSHLIGALIADGNVTYDCQTRLSCLNDRQIVNSLKSSGCRWVEIGIESMSQKVQDDFKQYTKLTELRDQLAVLREAGIGTCAFLINGLPNMTCSEMHEAIGNACTLIREDLLTATYFFGLVPYPGSRFYANPGESGMILRHHDYSLYNEELLPVYDTSHATAEKIYDVFSYGVHAIASEMANKACRNGANKSWEGIKNVRGSHV